MDITLKYKESKAISVGPNMNAENVLPFSTGADFVFNKYSKLY